MLQSDNRGFNRRMFGGAIEAQIDSIGRILIPDFLKERIGLKNTAAIVGVKDRVEVWSEKKWAEEQALVEKQAEALAEKLADSK